MRLYSQKKFITQLLMSMKTNYLNMWLFFMCLLVFATACEDKSFSPPSSNRNRVKFSLENISEKNTSSRSFSDGDSLLSSGIIPLEAEERTLYLHTSVTEGIDGSRLGKDESVTRATPVSDMNDYGSFSVFAASYQGAWSPDSQNMNFMYHVPVSLSGGVWSPQADYYWPGSGYKVRFFAYAPIDAEFEASNQSAAVNDFHIKYDVPTDVSKQKDLLVAKSTEYPGNHGNSVSLQFKHVLTAVRFVVGNDMKAGTVKKISLRNIASAGMYDPETGIGQVSGTVKDFGQELNKVTDGTPDSAITEPFQTFMLPPQSFTEDSSVIEVVFTDDEGEHTLTASLKGQTWMSGTTVTYTISTSSINWQYFLVAKTETQSDEFSFYHTGNTQKYSVYCYRKNGKGEKEAIPWHAKFSTDNGASWSDTPPAWVTTITSDAGGITPKSYNLTVSPQIAEDADPTHSLNLKYAPVKGSENSPYNLANQTNGGSAIENTANCYVVNAPGYYSFPLVYGNAIKNGVSNTSAYSFSVQNTSAIPSLSTFINHLGNGITDPYISRNAGCIPVKAELVWQDAMDLVTDIKYNNTADGNISFRVKQETICQGNAVIAIKDHADNVLWSWHIWVTDENLSQTIEVTSKSQRKYEFMPVYLGWCDKRSSTYPGRKCQMQFYSSVGNQKVSLNITQSQFNIRTIGDAPTYQWGRKDPIIAESPYLHKPRYDKNRDYTSNEFPLLTKTQIKTANGIVMNSILYPTKLAPIPDFAKIRERYGNLWWANFHYENPPVNIVKTIYDPSPVGFQIPPQEAFDGLILDHIGNEAYFFTNPSKNRTISFPLLGYHIPSIGGTIIDRIGSLWTAQPVISPGIDNLKAYNLYLKKSPPTADFRFYELSYGMMINPVRE